MRLRLISVLVATLCPVLAQATWQVVDVEQGKRVEIDRDSIVALSKTDFTAKGRLVLDRPIVDPKTSASYIVIEIFNRFNCEERSYATLKRSYYKEDGSLLRQEEVINPYDMPVRSGTPDDRLLREVCRPKLPGGAATSVGETVDKVNAAANELRKLNEQMVEKEVQKNLNILIRSSSPALATKRVSSRRKVPPMPAPVIDWDYAGEGGPAHWGVLKTEFAACASGRRQSPIDLRDGIAVDLEPVRSAYRPVPFRVVDTRRNLSVSVSGGGFDLLGRSYELSRIEFHRPSEFTIKGQALDMEAQLVHQSIDGKTAIVSVLLEKGVENPVVQMVLNNIPLEKGGEVAPPTLNLDVPALLPENRAYFTFMGSQTTPPCSEDVLWIVFKQPVQVSTAQLAIFQRLYPPNARPVQPAFGQIIKESR